MQRKRVVSPSGRRHEPGLRHLNATTQSSIAKLARAAAVLLTLGLFTIGSLPSAGQAFPGAMHWAAHLAVYALIAFTFGLGWPQWPAAHVVALAAAIGIIHEITEIITHSHVFETEDVIVNAIGALIGVTIQRILLRAISR